MKKISPIFSLVFLSVFVLFNALTGRKKLRVNVLDFAMLGLAVTRLSRTISYDKAMEAYRAPFVKTVPDPTGAGETTAPKNTSETIREIGTLLTCPVCVGTWISAALVYGLTVLPRQTRMLITIMGGIGLSELINEVIEKLQWSAQKAREDVGQMEKATNRAG